MNKIQSVLSWLAVLMPISIAIGRGVADANLTIIVVLFLVSCIIDRNWSWLKELWVRIAFCLWGYALLRSLFVPDISFALAKTLPLIRFFIFAIALQNIIAAKPETIKRIWFTLATVTSLLAADALLQFFSGFDITGKPLFANFRLTGPYSKPVIGANIAVLAAPVLAVIYWRATNSKNIVQIGSCAFLVAAIYLAVFLSNERSAFIQINLAVMLMLYFLNSNKKTVLACIAAVIAVLGIVVMLKPSIIERQLYSVVEIANNLPESVYGKLWIAGIKEGFDYPIFGVGARYYEQYCANYTDFCRYHPHNIYIEWFAEFGLVGLALFSALLISLFKKTISAYKTLSPGEMSYLALGSMVAVFIKILPVPSSGFFKNWYAVPLWFMIGLMLSAASGNKKDAA